MAQVTTKMLKYYEQCGLIAPVKIDPDSGYRYYGVEQLIPVAKIRTFLEMGFSTVEITSMLDAEDNTERFNRKIAELKAEIKQTERKTMLISFYKEAAKKHQFNQKYRVSLKDIEGNLVAAKRFILPDVFELPEQWKIFYEEVQDCCAKIVSFPNSFTCFHDKEFILENNEIELLLMIEKKGEESSDFEYKTLPPFQAVSIIHNGRYEFLNEAYAFVYRWMDFNGFIAAGNPMERYLKSIYNTDNEEEFITEILIPVT